MVEMERTTGGFNFLFEKELEGGETVIVKIPDVSPNKKSINDIGWQSDGDVTVYGTLAEDPEVTGTIWHKIEDGEEINKTVTAIKVTGGTSSCKIIIRVIFN